MVDKSVDIPEPLAQCFDFCQTVCAAECCGIDAFDPNQVPGWVNHAGAETAARALVQLRALIGAVSDPSIVVRSPFLQHNSVNNTTREVIVAFLEEFRTGLDSATNR